MRTRFLPLFAVLVVSSCASTIVETSDTTTTIAAPETTAVELPLADALAQMVTVADGLGDLIVEGGDGDDEALAQLHALWDGTDAAMNDIDPPLFREVEHQLGLIDTAVGRKRPADADKATRNLQVVVDTFLERHPG